ncbi:LPXTG cell wall anchor domain-containing protein [Lentzea sp. BCCO 10_0856]|uniref:LPXTG cell wall anchor domain-containing protein n=1 Tax=Lentzea miocenica TaxID=3095431 RepID=A0ABU4SYH3_9PSEU|nr:LPXTG cell wall anchor domain-containing protein [Lentzea sp. BCCO 10_0856]MDX8030788.1 LPXTG cell wall anchor domain-containing protein [Lentzea sp. BCCO 10_0856]
MRLALVLAQETTGLAIGDLALGVAGVIAVAAVIVVALKRKR